MCSRSRELSAGIAGLQHMTRALLLLAFISYASAAHATPVGGQPEVDPDERVLIDGSAPPSVLSRGTWTFADGGARLTAPATGHFDYLLPDGPGAHIADGMVRVRIQLSANPRATVLVRARPGDHPEALSAIGLSFRAGRVFWERWDDGVTLTNDNGVEVAGLEGRAVEVQILMAGPHLQATIWDAKTLAPIAVTVTRDRHISSGRVGIRVNGAADKHSIFQYLSVSGAPVSRLDSLSPPEPGAPLGTERFVLLRHDQIPALPDSFRHFVLGIWPYDDTGRTALLMQRGDLDRLRRQGMTPDDVRSLVPTWALDPDLQKMGTQVPTTARGFDLDASYHDATMVDTIVRGYAERYPHIAKVVELGTSHRGQPILALRITDHPDKDEHEPAVLLNAGHHGAELLATEYGLDAIRTLCEGYGSDARITRQVDGLDIWIVPLVNPDGNLMNVRVSRYSGRRNGRDTLANGVADPWEGVDLNRNYPYRWGTGEVASRSWPMSNYYRGPFAGSEPETQAIMKLAEERHFVASVSWHTNGTMVLAPYTIDGVKNPDPNTAWIIAEALVRATGPQSNGRSLKVRRKIYSVDGTDQDWLRHTFGTVAYILEGSHHNPTVRSTRLASVRRTRPFFLHLLDRVLAGPTLSGRVVDTSGRPVQAVVEVDVERWNAGEAWASRSMDGRFDRLLPTGGPVNVTIRAPGHAPIVQTVNLQGHTTIDVVLQDAEPNPR
ncbi:MAG: hypothetical protein ACI9MC_000342 [Kiritimatiellia bacterium]